MPPQHPWSTIWVKNDPEYSLGRTLSNDVHLSSQFIHGWESCPYLYLGPNFQMSIISTTWKLKCFIQNIITYILKGMVVSGPNIWIVTNWVTEISNIRKTLDPQTMNCKLWSIDTGVAIWSSLSVQVQHLMNKWLIKWNPTQCRSSKVLNIDSSTFKGCIQEKWS